MSPETISERAHAIRLGRKALAQHAQLSEKTIGMILRNASGGRHHSIVAIDNALIAEELRLRDYLLTLHPVKEEGKAA